MSKVNSVAELSEKLASLQFSATKVQILSDIADALVKSVQVQSRSIDEIFGNPAFHDYFSNVLLVHHATNDEKFKKKAFEFAFRGACLGLGLNARITANPTNPGADVIVDDQTFSLKTEAGKTISRTKITISKLMEARWIRDISSNAARGRMAAERIQHHLEQYDRIITLRAFDVFTQGNRTAARYELWEIPVAVLRSVGNLQVNDFSQPTLNNSFTATIKILNPTTGTSSNAFTLRLDGSVEKVTIGGLSTEYCIHHVTWTVPIDPTEDESE